MTDPTNHNQRIANEVLAKANLDAKNYPFWIKGLYLFLWLILGALLISKDGWQNASPNDMTAIFLLTMPLVCILIFKFSVNSSWRMHWFLRILSPCNGRKNPSMKSITWSKLLCGSFFYRPAFIFSWPYCPCCW